MKKLMIASATSPVELSKIILGSTMFGTKIEEKTSFALMDKYAELGGDSIDTAGVYGDWHDTGDPVSERTIGKWLKQSGCKNKMKIITKGAHFRLKSPQESRVSAACIQDDIQKSLKSLQVDVIDEIAEAPDGLDAVHAPHVDVTGVRRPPESGRERGSTRS